MKAATNVEQFHVSPHSGVAIRGVVAVRAAWRREESRDRRRRGSTAGACLALAFVALEACTCPSARPTGALGGNEQPAPAQSSPGQTPAVSGDGGTWVATPAPGARPTPVAQDRFDQAWADLFAPEAATRIAAANILVTLPEERIHDLLDLDKHPCAEARDDDAPVPPACRFFLHGAYQLIEVLAAHARRELLRSDPDACLGSPRGTSCEGGEEAALAGLLSDR